MYYTYNHVYVTIKLHASFKAELGPERPSSWDPTRMGKHEAALTHSAPLHASVLDTCQNGRRGFDLHIDHVSKVIDNDTCCPKIVKITQTQSDSSNKETYDMFIHLRFTTKALS